MRCALLVAAASFPALALAAGAGSGQVLEVNHYDVTNNVSYVNAAACATGGKANLEWNLKTVQTGANPTTGTTTLFSSNKDPSTRTGADQNFCNESPDTQNNISAGQVGSAATTSSLQDLAVLGKDIANKAGKSCDSSSETQSVWVCAHWSSTSTSTHDGWAWGRFVIQVLAPNAPTLTSVGAGDGQLIAGFTPPADQGATAVDHYVACAMLPGTTTEISCSASTAGSPATISGLENNTAYDVAVFSVSVGGNRSTASSTMSGTPLPAADFWDVYKDRGGVERGGCGTGAAGAPALLGAIALLALRRRAS